MLRLLAATALITWQLTAPGPALAGAGDLDPSFGSGGIVTTDFNYGSFDRAYALVFQPDGELVAAGSGSAASRPTFGLARYRPNGRLDEDFGTGGTVTTAFVSGYGATAQALVIQSDGKLVAAGSADTGGPNLDSDFALARYNADGTLDPTFGTGGTVTTDFGDRDRATALALQADGKLVVAGSTPDSYGALPNFALARYNPDGTLDPTFGTGGKVTTDLGGAAVNALAVRDGKLVAAGWARGATLDFALARYNPDGTLDPTFGTGGTVTTDFAGRGDQAYALSVQADGKLVAAGSTGGDSDYDTDFALTRYNADGNLDTEFGTGGKVTTDFPIGYVDGSRAEAYALAVQGGKLVAAGYAIIGSRGDLASYDFALARYNSDGTLDTRFGTGGKVTTNRGGRSADLAQALAVQGDDGKLVAAGSTIATYYGATDFCLMRYQPGS